MTQDAAAPAPGPAGPAANTQFTLLAANASLAVAPDNTTTLTLSGLVPTAVYTQTAPVRDVGIYNASFFTAAPFYVGRSWLGQPDAVLLGGGGAVATAVVMRLQARALARLGGWARVPFCVTCVRLGAGSGVPPWPAKGQGKIKRAGLALPLASCVSRGGCVHAWRDPVACSEGVPTRAVLSLHAETDCDPVAKAMGCCLACVVATCAACMHGNKTHSWLLRSACQQRCAMREWGRWRFRYCQEVCKYYMLGLSTHGLSTQGVPYYDNNTFTVNATLLSAPKQLKYAGGRAAAALLQVTHADVHAGVYATSVRTVSLVSHMDFCSIGRCTCCGWLQCMCSRNCQPAPASWPIELTSTVLRSKQ